MILKLEGVMKRFGGLVAVRDVSLSVEQGRIFGLIGPNGAGKTTLLNLIAGVLNPEAGKILYQGEDIVALSSDRVCRKGISRTFQIARPFPRMTVMENVMVAAVYGGGRRGHQSPAAKATAALRFVNFPLSPDTPVDRLNTVQLKRLDLARALASLPRLLLLDEIAAGLTPVELTELMRLLRRIRDEGVTIIVVEHLMRMIMETCDRIAVLHFGAKIAEGEPAEIVRNQLVTEAYLGDKYFL
jgi:branched-chain amino acid transport system ATP-binding protein